MAVRKHSAARAAVRKAKPDESWVALYDENGQLLGICQPSAITPVANGTSAAPKPKAAPAAAPKAAATAAPAGGEPAEMAKQRAVAQLRKGLNAPGLASDNDRHAAAMGEVAQRMLHEIHQRPRGR